MGLAKSVASTANLNALSMTDREMLSRYLALSVDARNTVRDVVTALAVAATVKSKD